MDVQYYKKHAIRICSKISSGVLPVEENLRKLLTDFGAIWDLYMFHVPGGVYAVGPPNNAIAVFESPGSAWRTLESSRNEKAGDIWPTYSMTAHPIMNGGYFHELFSTITVPKLNALRANGKYTNLSNAPRSSERQLAHTTSLDYEPTAKRHRIGFPVGSSYDTTAINKHVATSGSSPTSSVVPESPDWMRTRIAQLETELYVAKAARDMAISEQDVIRKAHQAEQIARREAMSQKSAAEAALSRGEVEQNRLRTELDAAVSQKSDLSNDLENLCGQFAVLEEDLKLVRLSLDMADKSNERVKSLQLELEEAQDRAQKLQLQQFHTEERKVTFDISELEDAKTKIKQLKSRVKQLKSDLAATQKQLDSTQQSLESKERKCSSTRRRYKSTKEKLGTYKTQLENERTLLQKLRTMLTPAAYESLGATHETLGAFLSAMGLPPVGEEGNAGPKEESE
ncbi:hypothetical protein V565_217120 [Rhizoctonia solani 123E]|uniref:Uncharacterized protein n=1 Tax=Rhizoctonia solani 123E TaxID=1423351 RepID=A0A074RG64_9AGAM|nr:hypothetical protein V565_217120 [Rhizoctonia solani 123E]